MNINITFNPYCRLFLFLTFISLVLIFGAAKPVSAVSGDEFKPGRIIDDAVFYDSNAMSTNQIQKFLEAKLPSCDTNGSKSFSYHYNSTTGRVNNSSDPWVTTSRATYGARYDDWRKSQGLSSKGSRAPYTCLKSYSQDTPQEEAASGLCESIPSRSSRSSAQIIDDVAKACGINPQVLLVLLQKEQSLVTDDWPWGIQYEKATGFACPDTASCDSSYGGFFHQVYSAGLQFKMYRANPGNYNYQADRNNQIYWHPDLSRCGSSTVYIENQATAGLYNYTPYQPNKASLDSYPGTGNSCSSYGNRNFWFKFHEWFGSTYAGAHHASWQDQSAYPSLKPGESKEVYITYRNDGHETWYDNVAIDDGTAPSWASPVRLATYNPINRSSDFGSTWAGSDRNRAAHSFATVYKVGGEAYATNPHKVEPGESVKFKFVISVPDNYSPGNYKEYFVPLVEGDAIMNDSTVYLKVTVEEVYSADFKTQSSYPTIKPGESTVAFFEYTNSGNTVWYDKYATTHGIAPKSTEPIKLKAYPEGRTSILNDEWPSSNIAATSFSRVYRKNGDPYSSNPHKVAPGESVRISFQLNVPENQPSGGIKEELRPFKTSVGYIPPAPTFLNVTIPDAHTAKPTQSQKTSKLNPLSEKTLSVSFRNTGNLTWEKSTTALAVSGSGIEAIKDSGWIDNTTPSRMNESSVAPGETGTFEISLVGPNKAHRATLNVSPRIDDNNIAVNSMEIDVNTPEPNFSATYQGQSAYPTLKQNSQKGAHFLFKNTGNIEWRDAISRTSEIKPVVLAATNRINRKSKFNDVFDRSNRPTVVFESVYESDGTTLASDQHVAQPGQIVKFGFTFDAPDDISPGKYREWFQPIVEGGDPWQMGGKVFLDVTVKDAVYKARYRGQAGYPTLAPGESTNVHFLFENVGNTTWFDNTGPQGIQPVRLATTMPINRSSQFIGSNRPTGNFKAVYKNDGSTLTENQSVVKPGEVVRMEFTLTAPDDISPGKYREWFQPILERGNPWDMKQKVFLDVHIE